MKNLTTKMLMRVNTLLLILGFLSLDCFRAFTPPKRVAKDNRLNKDNKSVLFVSTTETIPTSKATVLDTKPNLSKSGHNHEAWKRGFTTCPQEIQPTVLDFPDLPADFPVGTYYRNGHGRFESDDGVRVLHPFDGDGLVTATTFDPVGKRVLFRNRFIRTEGYVKDKATKSMSQPGVFGTKVSGGLLKNLFRQDFKNVANTHVLYAAGTLYALWEAGWPYRLDPLTLENDIKTEPAGHDMNGLLKEKEPLAAHYRYDPATNTYVDFSVNLNPSEGKTVIKLYEFDATTLEPKTVNEVSASFPGCGLIHDFALTKNWCVFSIPPAKIDNFAALRALFGQGAFSDVINFQNDANESLIVLIPRIQNLNGDTKSMKIGVDDRIKVVMVPYHFGFHFSNAYEDCDGNIEVDIVQMTQAVVRLENDAKVPAWEAVSWEKDLFSPSYVRYIIEPNGEGRMLRPPQFIVNNRASEFPSVPKQLSTKPFRYSYLTATHKAIQPDSITGAGSGPGGAIAKVVTKEPSKTEFYSFQPYEFVGEPIFVAKSGADVTKAEEEDKGYILTQVVNGDNLTTDLVVLDVEGEGALQKGPVARLRLPTFIPFGLHGVFVDDLTFEF